MRQKCRFLNGLCRRFSSRSLILSSMQFTLTVAHLQSPQATLSMCLKLYWTSDFFRASRWGTSSLKPIPNSSTLLKVSLTKAAAARHEASLISTTKVEVDMCISLLDVTRSRNISSMPWSSIWQKPLKSIRRTTSEQRIAVMLMSTDVKTNFSSSVMCLDSCMSRSTRHWTLLSQMGHWRILKCLELSGTATSTSTPKERSTLRNTGATRAKGYTKISR